MRLDWRGKEARAWKKGEGKGKWWRKKARLGEDGRGEEARVWKKGGGKGRTGQAWKIDQNKSVEERMKEKGKVW